MECFAAKFMTDFEAKQTFVNAVVLCLGRAPASLADVDAKSPVPQN